jgi:prolyl oligopeptidase
MNSLAYPPARRDGTAEVRHGRVIADPYRWLEDATAPETVAWSREQRELTAAYLESLPSRAAFTRRLAELGRVRAASVPVRRGDQEFFLGRGPRGPALYGRGPDGAERLVYDPAALGPPGQVSLDGWALSPAGGLLAVQTSLNGAEQALLRIVDLASGEVTGPPIDGVRYSTIAWLPDDSGFFYVRTPPADHPQRPADRRPAGGHEHRGVRVATRHEPGAGATGHEPGAGATGHEPGGADEPAEGPGARVWLHRLGDGRDVPVFGSGAEPRAVHRVRLDHGRWLVVSTRTGTGPANRLHLADLASTPAGAPRFAPIPLASGSRALAQVSRQGVVYLHTTDGAPRGRIRAVHADDLASPAEISLTEILPEDPGAVLSGFALLGDDGTRIPRLLVAHTRHSVAELTLRDGTSGRLLATIPLPGAGTVRDLTTDPATPSTAWFTYTDHLTPPTVLRHDLHDPPAHRHAIAPPQEIHTHRDSPAAPPAQRHAITSSQEIHTLKNPPAAPPAQRHGIASWQETYASADGTPVRMFLLAPSRHPDRARPTLLTAYGGFGVSMTPSFDPNVLAWVEQGGVFAVACVRGGGDEGEAWHRAGAREHKANTFADLHAAAGHLIATGRTDRTRLGLIGASNAGLLAAVAVTQRPDLYRAAVCLAPLTDMARYELSGMGPAWRAEYGTADRPGDLDLLLSYSPYHRVTPGTPYPACLFVSFAQDTRVDPLHARKLTAALQHATTSPAPVLLRSYDALGHGPRPTSAATLLGADTLAFLAHQTGLTVTGF